ncbi:MAG: ATP-binding protein [Candidatus Geothermincolia bacterium]
MLITGFKLEHYKKFDEVSLELGPGLNLIRGPNESGKSSLIQALTAAFFWKVTAARKEIAACRPWGSDLGFRLAMQGEEAGEPWELAKDFAEKRSSLKFQGNTITDPNRINEVMAGWLGLASEELYRCTAGIRQEEVQEISSGTRQLSESLQSTAAGGGTGAESVLRELKGALDELIRGSSGMAKRPGKIRAAEEQLAALGESERVCRARVESVEGAMAELAAIEGRRAKRDEELGALDQVLAASDECGRLEKDVERLKRDFGQLGTLAGLQDESRRLQGEAARFALLAEMDGELERVQTLGERRRGLELAVEGLRQEPPEPAAVPSRRVDALLWGLAAALIATGAAGIFFTSLAALPLALGILIALGAGLRLFARRMRATSVPDAGAGPADLERQLLEVNAEMEALARSAGCDGFEELRSLAEAYDDHRAACKTNAEQMAVLRVGGLPEDTALDTLAADISIKETRLGTLRPVTLNGVELQAAKNRRERLAVDKSAEATRVIQLNVAAQGGDPEELQRLQEEMTEVEGRLAARRRQAEVYRKAYEMVERAAREMGASFSEVLEAEIGESIGVITEGKYQRVLVDPRTFEMQIVSGERVEPVPAALLSHGTVDQLYLAARLALMRAICGESRPPLVMDDSFVAYDAERLARALRLLRSLAADYQVLLFSCYDELAGYADRVIDLPLVSQVRRTP